MTKIYQIIGDLRDVYIGISLQYTNNKYEAEDAVSMLMEYFMCMNKDTLQQIYKSDGKDGLIKYGAVALRRSFTSPRSKFYYTYKRYGSIIDDSIQLVRDNDNTKDINNILYITDDSDPTWVYFEKLDKALDSMYWYDRDVYKLYYNVEKKETLDSLAKKTKISRSSLFTTINNVKIKLKEILSDE